MDSHKRKRLSRSVRFRVEESLTIGNNLCAVGDLQGQRLGCTSSSTSEMQIVGSHSGLPLSSC